MRMRIWSLASYVAFLAFILGSCASEKTVTREKAKPSGLAKYESDVSYQVNEDGSVQPNSDKRSSFERTANYSNIREQSRSNYYTEGYSKKGFNANKSYSAEAYYGGEKSGQFAQSPHFAQQQSRLQNQAANATGEGYDTSQFYSGSQSVNRGQQQARTANASLQSEADSYVQPEVKSLDEANGLTVDDTNFMLGR